MLQVNAVAAQQGQTKVPKSAGKKGTYLNSCVAIHLCTRKVTRLAYRHAARHTDQSAGGKRKREQALPEQENVQARAQKGKKAQAVAAGNLYDCIAY